MSIPVDIEIASPDPSVHFTTVSDLVALLRLLTTAEIPVDLNTFVISSTTPAVDDQDKIWQRTSAGPTGKPMGIYKFYSGRWVLNPPPIGGRIGFFSGDPTGVFDETGLGLPGGGDVANDLYGWALANGLNGTADLSDKFIIGAHMNNEGDPGWSTGDNLWRTKVTGEALTEGGATEVTLDTYTTYQREENAVKVGKFMADGNTRDESGGLYGSFSDGEPEATLISEFLGNTSPDPINIIPPFYALAIIAWLGYP